jgi:thioredoxin-related protein
MQLLKTSFLVLGVIAATAAPGAEWRRGAEQGTLAAAVAQAKREGKILMFNFTGSDWCRWCKLLKEEVFSKPEFDSYARKHLVLVEIDFPRRVAQSEALKTANRELAKTMGVTGYPTLVFLDSDGNAIGSTGYQPGGVGVFIRGVAKLTGRPGAEPRANLVAAPQKLPPASPTLGGAAPPPPIRYTNLVLKTISGTPKRRTALLNDQTFTDGVTLPVKLQDRKVNVRCVEVREQSVLVAVQGENGLREIKLRP